MRTPGLTYSALRKYSQSTMFSRTINPAHHQDDHSHSETWWWSHHVASMPFIRSHWQTGQGWEFGQNEWKRLETVRLVWRFAFQQDNDRENSVKLSWNGSKLRLWMCSNGTIKATSFPNKTNRWGKTINILDRALNWKAGTFYNADLIHSLQLWFDLG